MSSDDIKQALAEMEQNVNLVTKPNYQRTLADIQLLSFGEWHLNYLSLHPKVNAANYLANLRVMIKTRPQN
jgi:hypothetical protein